ncbi:deoxyribonuclease [Oceanisphaera marina]|uniref:Deoxyribonuclease n=1 Tax=Oceanisphaera marina TaxID=2017550 RepID=A0ABQ1ISF6_9GAMM|nr:TatD family hydrolase [Oceanisphaera marina]GGB49456.1 deoxyribonuclease [Oceanisphaera marina]
MLMTDSHCHFDFAAFEPDRAQHWRRAQLVGVHRLVIPGIEEAQWPDLPLLCAAHPGLYYALGLHPWWLARASTAWQSTLAKALDNADNRCVAVGEMGLDRSLTLAPDIQETALIAQLELAIQYQLPVILHSHGTHDRVLKWLRRYPVKGGVVHGFSGSVQQAETFWMLGIHIGVGGTITYDRANKTRQAVAALPVEALVLETDAPDMPLCGFQGQPNHPAQLPRVLTALAELRQQDEALLAEQLESNVNQLFDFSE